MIEWTLSETINSKDFDNHELMSIKNFKSIISLTLIGLAFCKLLKVNVK